MKQIQCPEVYSGNEKSLFIAGGISDCPDWQLELIELLKSAELVILNPKRKKFDITDLKMEKEQIKWEFNHLNKATVVSFWFPKETLCPITLYELGKQATLKKPLFVGVHPAYKRKRDLEIQLTLARPEVKIVYSLPDLAKQLKKLV